DVHRPADHQHISAVHRAVAGQRDGGHPALERRVHHRGLGPPRGRARAQQDGGAPDDRCVVLHEAAIRVVLRAGQLLHRDAEGPQRADDPGVLVGGAIGILGGARRPQGG
ncbi:MAG: hypothetical protein ACK55I_35790, partial [bacterium]